MRTLLITLALLVGLVAPAHADDEVLPATPTVEAPLLNETGGPATRVRVQIAPHAGRNTWRIKRVARAWDYWTPNLSVEVGSCVPNVPCVNVMVGGWDSHEMAALAQGITIQAWSGLTLYNDLGTSRTVLLNRSTTGREYRMRITSHEIAHALGLSHHAQPDGILCVSPAPCDDRYWAWEPSGAELAAIQNFYVPSPVPQTP